MSRAELRAAKEQALELFSEELVVGFQKELERRYGLPRDRVIFKRADAIRRIKEAVYLNYTELEEDGDEYCGMTDGDTIWVMRNLTFADLVETLIHEALHDSMFIEAKTRSGVAVQLPEETEHAAMYPMLEHIFSH